MIFIKLLYSLAMIAGGAAIIKYRRTIKGWTGNFVWAERYIGRGGTYFALVIIGILLIFYGVIYPFGGIDLLLGNL